MNQSSRIPCGRIELQVVLNISRNGNLSKHTPRIYARWKIYPARSIQFWRKRRQFIRYHNVCISAYDSELEKGKKWNVSSLPNKAFKKSLVRVNGRYGQCGWEDHDVEEVRAARKQSEGGGVDEADVHHSYPMDSPPDGQEAHMDPTAMHGRVFVRGKCKRRSSTRAREENEGRWLRRGVVQYRGETLMNTLTGVFASSGEASTCDRPPPTFFPPPRLLWKLHYPREQLTSSYLSCCIFPSIRAVTWARGVWIIYNHLKTEEG